MSNIAQSYPDINTPLLTLDTKLASLDTVFGSITSAQQLTAQQAVSALDLWMKTLLIDMQIHGLDSQDQSFGQSTFTNSYGITDNVLAMWDSNLTAFEGRMRFLTDPSLSLTPPFEDVNQAVQEWFVSESQAWHNAISSIVATINSIGPLSDQAQANGDTEAYNKYISQIKGLTDLMAGLAPMSDKLDSIVSQLQAAGVGTIRGNPVAGWKVVVSILAGAAIFVAGIVLAFTAVASAPFGGIIILALIATGVVVAAPGLFLYFGPAMAGAVGAGIHDSIQASIDGAIHGLQGQKYVPNKPLLNSNGTQAVDQNGKALYVDEKGNTTTEKGHYTGGFVSGLSGVLALGLLALGALFLLSKGRKRMSEREERK